MVFSFCVKRFLLSRSNGLKIPKRNGYIVLLPEIGEENPHQNLLKEDKTLEFNNITIENCIAVLRRQTMHCNKQIQEVETQIANKKDVDIFNDVLPPLEEVYVPLGITWGIAQVLYYGNQTLIPTKSFIAINQNALNTIHSKFSNPRIYEACKSLKENKKVHLTDQQERILYKYLLEGKLNGLDLSEKSRKWFIHSYKLLHLQESDFYQRLQVVKKHCSFTLSDPKMVKDFPEELLEATVTDPKHPHVGPWTITLDKHVLKLFLEYCPKQDLRRKMWEADATLLSPADDKLFQTNAILNEIYLLRKQQAQVFGYKSYANFSMETKMARSLDEVYDTFDTLLESAYPAQEHEIETLNKFATTEGFEGPLKPWDVLYWNRKYHDSISKFKRKALKNYFPLPKVLSGLFELFKENFGIHIVENKNVNVWHKDVTFYDVFNTNISDTEPIGNFYLDPYTKDTMKPNVDRDPEHMIIIKNRSKLCDTKPTCALIFNFKRPKDGQPLLLSFENVQTLFQKFGHALQHLTNMADYVDISGMSFIEWDAGYIYDYFVENWLYEPSTLLKISEHYETKDALPNEAIEVIEHLRSQLIGYDLCKELLFSRLDFEVHESGEHWSGIMERLWKQHFVMPLERNDVYIYSFEHIFSVQLSTNYYGRLWSKMIAADVYSAFQEISPENQTSREEICKRYQNTFLSLNGCCPTSEIFRRFRGRDPNPQALLKILKLSKTD